MNAAEVAASTLAAPVAEITIWSMFWGAHIVVKCVILGLLCASIWSVMVIIDKSLLIRRTRRTMDLFDEAFWSGNSLEELYNKVSERPTNGTASLFVAAMREWKRSLQSPNASFMGLHSRIDKVLDVSIGREIEKLESSLLVLATVASASPFVGLFGTVWGIMTAFRSIAASKNTSLAVVAPGIAEALFATAVGLVAAIPALIFYNKLQGDVSKAQGRLETFADEFSAILSRQIDQTAGGRDRAA
ncbi:protein TolQ [Methylocystis bryophila]|uniref:Tol-Pal system protein TolQ n=1 Tax=Methylocystis bryophila TaxID=655015 RepID=A0A1W6MRB0_9HYPH|nr:protein TolQ [Methylocystis bryophila]ARN80134.1 protein TolQ [Methylocystis bryophila]BDV40075.1 Tol-Pal system subunit TolQ [Methylocystis bryophila]